MATMPSVEMQVVVNIEMPVKLSLLDAIKLRIAGRHYPALVEEIALKTGRMLAPNQMHAGDEVIGE